MISIDAIAKATGLSDSSVAERVVRLKRRGLSEDDARVVVLRVGRVSKKAPRGPMVPIDKPAPRPGSVGPFAPAKATALEVFERDYFARLAAESVSVSDAAQRAGMERAHVRMYLRRHAIEIGYVAPRAPVGRPPAVVEDPEVGKLTLDAIAERLGLSQGSVWERVQREKAKGATEDEARLRVLAEGRKRRA